MTLAIRHLFHLKILERFYEIILDRSEFIDSGEKEKDHNRIIWDLLAPCKGIILKFLPGHMEKP